MRLVALAMSVLLGTMALSCAATPAATSTTSQAASARRATPQSPTRANAASPASPALPAWPAPFATAVAEVTAGDTSPPPVNNRPSVQSDMVPPAAPAAGLADRWRQAVMRTTSVEVALQPLSTVVVADSARHVGLLDPQRSADVAPNPPRALAEQHDLELFLFIGFTWQGPEQTDARFRVHHTTGWSDWRPVTRNADHGPDPGSPEARRQSIDSVAVHLASDSVWVGEADGWQLDVDPEAKSLVVRLVGPDADLAAIVAAPGPLPLDPHQAAAPAFETQAVTPLASPLSNVQGGGTTAAASGTGLTALTPRPAMERPAVISRAEWGAAPPTAVADTATRLHLAVLHHTVGDSAHAAEDVPQILRNMQSEHMTSNLWDDIGYNFLIDRFGRIFEGRNSSLDALAQGAHSGGVNYGSVGVALLGNFMHDEPSEAALDAAVELVAWMLFRHGADPGVEATMLPREEEPWFFPPLVPVTLPRIVGHQDVNATLCPGDLEDRLSEIRERVQLRYDELVAATRFLADGALTRTGHGQPAVGDFNRDGRDDVFWYRPGPDLDELWLANDHGGFASSSFAVPDYGGVNTKMTQLDWDGDGSADLLFSTPGRSTVSLVRGSPSGTLSTSTLAASGSALPVVGDFDADGDEEILFYRSWLSTLPLIEFDPEVGSHRTDWTITGGPYRVVVGDFDGDLRSDVLWYQPGAAADSVWYGRGPDPFLQTPITMGGDYQPVSTDLDGDQHDDIVWLNQFGRTGATLPIWYGGSVFRPTLVTHYGADTTMVLTDIDGGGSADVVTVDENFVATVWLRQGASERLVRRAQVPLGVAVLSIDSDGDGRHELWWWSQDQPVLMWLPF